MIATAGAAKLGNRVTFANISWRLLQWAASAGIVCLVLLGLPWSPVVRERLAVAALFLLAVAVAAAWLTVWTLGPPQPKAVEPRTLATATQWRIAGFVVAGGGVLLPQTWFRFGTAIAQGDTAPPEGTAWLGRVFSSWSWSGANLGGPSSEVLQGPWAAVLWASDHVGISAAIAQRLWYTTLFLAAALSIFWLLSLCRLGPIASSVGAFAYVLSPYLVSNLNIYPNYLAALALLAFLPAVIIWSARRASVLLGATLLCLTAPMLGYVYLNPPLLGMCLLAFVAGPAAAWLLDGPERLSRSIKVVGLGLILALGLSAYWVVPTVSSLTPQTAEHLRSIASWSWTEARATVSNAFWLNTAWSWTFAEYAPFASAYEVLPISVAKYIPAAAAFSSLLIAARHKGDIPGAVLRLKVTAAAASVAVFVLLLSTGTNPPGNILFDRLYALPGGWLLREPGRFLMATALAYSVLIGVFIEQLAVQPEQRLAPWDLTRLFRSGSVLVIATAIALSGFPIVTGAIVPDYRPLLPSAHVALPGYWREAADFLNGLKSDGSVLVLPPDDFYQMPYRWGYYGTDTFIPNLVERPVILPFPQGYSPSSAALLVAVSQTSDSILSRNWQMAHRLLDTLGAHYVLVREDVDATFPSRAIASPYPLAAALHGAPGFILLREFGPVKLFETTADATRPFEATKDIATDNAGQPDLRVLAKLPLGYHLVSAAAAAGLLNVIEAPSLANWHLANTTLSWNVVEPSFWRYQLQRIDGSDAPAGQISLGAPGMSTAQRKIAGGEVALTVTVDGHALLDESPNARTWQTGDCNNVLGATSFNFLGADFRPTGGPSGAPSARLSARADSACIARRLPWTGGAIYVSLALRHASGSLPRLCLWESGIDKCAPLPQPAATEAWSRYAQTVVPEPGATSLSIYVYSDAASNGIETVNEYSDFHVLELPAIPSFALIGTSASAAPSTQQLLLLRTSYSSQWQGPPGAAHVVVDGLFNGWLVDQLPRAGYTARYVMAGPILAARMITIGFALVVFFILGAIGLRKLAVRLRGT